MIRKEVYKAINTERDYQDEKWGDPQDDNYISYPEPQFLIDIEKHLNDAKAAQYEMNKNEVRDQIRKIAALCVKFGEVHDIRDRI